MFLNNSVSLTFYCHMKVMNEVIYFKPLHITVKRNKILGQMRFLKILNKGIFLCFFLYFLLIYVHLYFFTRALVEAPTTY